jgi:CheY-like chemotaxis protein/two-component sensor histidine kinase
MSHELRTPMNGVLGMIDIAKRRMADPKGLDYLGKAKLSADRLLGVLNDILDISKIEAGRMVFESIPLQLSVVVDNLTSTLGHKATEKGLRLATDLPADLMRQPLKGDPLRLGQILFNLVGNAIKFTPQGEVTLRARAVEESEKSVQVRFEVSDTGIGIELEAQSRLFQSFEQADNSMTRNYGGTGLGLAISKRLVNLMGGTIGMESTPGTGSTFWFVVPLKKREADAVPPAPTFTALTAEQRLQAEYAGTRILLAEDEPIAQEVSRGLLEDVGLLVDLAEDGQQALELAKQNTYALILMDMQMPNLNGVAATQAIRALPAYAQTPILALTANAFDEDRQRCLDAGMNDHIAKPVDPDRLYETLLAWLERPDNRPGSLQRNSP